METYKICIKCKTNLPRTVEYFYYRNKNRGWFSSWCKKCKKEHRKENMVRELELQNKRREIKPCKICETNNKPYGNTYCISCLKKKKRKVKREDKALYRGRLRKAKPKWANSFYLKEIYRLARLRTRITGVEWHVDHIIPIRSNIVCGLHTHENLQVISKQENIIKSNHYSLEHEGRR